MTSSARTDYDVIVMGGGPSGAAAARTLTQRGLAVALIDKAHFPRDKLCGGCFTGRSHTLFRQIYGSDIPDSFLDTKSAISFFAHGQDLGTITDIPPIYLTLRRQLDTEMFRRAVEGGAIAVTGTRVSSIDPEAPSITLQDGRQLTARILIGADGVNSQVARQLFGKSFDRTHTAFGLEIEAPPSPTNQDAPLRIDFGAATWGYGWSFPKSGSTTIGICGLLPDNPDMKTTLRKYLTDLGQDPEIHCKGHFLPFGDFRKVPGNGAVLLVGDAAGLVDPITGEGIALAMESGHLAALAAADALTANAPRSAITRYRKMLRPIHRSLRQARMLRRLIYAPLLNRPFISAFRKSRTIRRLYMQMLAGEANYGDVMRATLRRLPAFALGAMLTRQKAETPKG